MRTNSKNVHLVLFSSLLLALGLFVGCGSDSAPAAPAVDTVPPAIPGGVSAWSASSDGVAITWDANVTDPDLAGYLVYRSDQAAEGYRPMQTAPLTTNGWEDSSANPGSTYWYRVSARDASNNESGLSQSFSVTVPEDGGPESSPMIQD